MIFVSEFVDQCSLVRCVKFAPNLSENYMYASENPPSKESIVSYLFKGNYKRLGDVLMSQYFEHPHHVMALPLTTLMNATLERAFHRR